MVVKHNLTAMNSNRMLGLTTTSQAKATEKLSSGYKVNRAADDAAGLAISEKMRKQIRGLTQASLNAKDGISAIQTAEGALAEVHDMLHRMTELAVKAANGTMSESDREAIQSEVDQLVTEIDRVSTTTKFNETYLLKGANGGQSGSLTYNTAVKALLEYYPVYGEDGVLLYKIPNMDSTTGVAEIQTSPVSVTRLKWWENESTDNVDWSNAPADATIYCCGGEWLYDCKELDGNRVYFKGKEYSYLKSRSLNSYEKYEVYQGGFVEHATLIKDEIRNQSLKILSADELDKIAATLCPGYYTSVDEMLAAIKHDHSEDIKSITSFSRNGYLQIRIETFADVNDALDFSLHVGADSSDDNKIYVNIAQMSARSLGINGLLVNGADAGNATAAIDVIADALQKVSNQRATLGAVQNRLEHTVNNLDNIVENTTSAESAIRDTDMAAQMVAYSNYNILAQAGQAMLAQANQTNQGVMSLLGG